MNGGGTQLRLRSARRLYRLGLALLLSLVGSSVLGQPTTGSAPLDLSGLLSTTWQALTSAGCRLERLPHCRVGTAADLNTVVEPEVGQQLHWQLPELTAETRARAEAAAMAAWRSTLLAHGDSGQDTLLVFPDQARQMAGWEEGLDRLSSPEVLRLALVEEAVRLDLERRYDLARRRVACRDSEEFLALQAVVEGRILWVTQRVARSLGQEYLFPLLLERYLHVPDTGTDPLTRLASQETLRQRYRAGKQGLAFFTYLEQQGVQDAEQRVLSRPPHQVAWVARPEVYWRAQQANRAELADVLAVLEQALPATDWTVGHQPWTPEMLRQTAALFGQQERAERVLAGWEEGHSLMWVGRSDPNRQVGVGVVRFQDGMAARAYFGFAGDLQRQQEEALAGATAGRVLESHAQAVSLPGADEAACTQSKFQLGSHGPPLAVSQVWARKGDLVFQFSWHGAAVDVPWAARILQEVTAHGRQ